MRKSSVYDIALANCRANMWDPMNPFESRTEKWYEYNLWWNKIFNEAQLNLTREEYRAQMQWDGEKVINPRDKQLCMF